MRITIRTSYTWGDSRKIMDRPHKLNIEQKKTKRTRTLSAWLHLYKVEKQGQTSRSGFFCWRKWLGKGRGRRALGEPGEKLLIYSSWFSPAPSSVYISFCYTLGTTLPHWTFPSVFSDITKLVFHKSFGIVLHFVFPENPSSLIRSASVSGSFLRTPVPRSQISWETPFTLPSF